MPQSASISSRISKRIDRTEPGWVFTPGDFLDLGSPHSVGMALTRLQRAGRIRRLTRGIYDLPKSHPSLGSLAPSPDSIAQAISRRNRSKIQPSEAMAANLLHLSEQVPAIPTYGTDGRSRTVRVGNQTVKLKNAAARKLGAAAMSNLVFAALRGIGRPNVTVERIAPLRDALSATDRKQLIKDLPLAPAWMHPFLRSIAEKRPAGARE